MNSKQPELNKGWRNFKTGYAYLLTKAMVIEATKIRNKNRNNSPAKILDNLTVKINRMAKEIIRANGRSKNPQIKTNPDGSWCSGLGCNAGKPATVKRVSPNVGYTGGNNKNNSSIEQNFVKLTKAMKDLAKKSLNESDYANVNAIRKTEAMWRDAASKLEAQVNFQIRKAQDQVDSV